MNSSISSSTQKKTRILDEEIKDQSLSNENDRDSPVIVDITLKPSYMSKTSRITEIIHKMKELNMNRIEDGSSFNKKEVSMMIKIFSYTLWKWRRRIAR